MIRLGMNIDHVATLRQLRAGSVDYPDVIEAARVCMESGADQITVHLRGDRRHIQENDVIGLLKKKFPVNLEMAATPEMVAFALQNKPQIVCLVPEKREELTTEGGLDVAGQIKKIRKSVDMLHAQKIKISLFIEAEESQVKAAAELGVYAVEFHTGQYALAKTKSAIDAEFKKIEKACVLANKSNIHVHAGHGLDYKNVSQIRKLPHLEELNIGHSIVCRAVMVGLGPAVSEMKKLIQ